MYRPQKTAFPLLTFRTLPENWSLQINTGDNIVCAINNPSISCYNREDDLSQPPDACRIHGHLYVNKVAGNFHITVGKYVLFTYWKYFRQVVSLLKVNSLLK